MALFLSSASNSGKHINQITIFDNIAVIALTSAWLLATGFRIRRCGTGTTILIGTE